MTLESLKSHQNLIGRNENQLVNDHRECIIINKISTDKKQIVYGFQNYFINIGKGFDQQITSTTDPLSYINTNINSIYIPDISKDARDEFITVINSLKNYSPGCNEMFASILK